MKRRGARGRRGVAGLLRWLFAPLWLAEVFTATKSFKFNPILGSERLNRAGLHVWRSRLAHRMAWRRRAKLAHLIDPADREAFDRDGFLAKRGFAPPELFAALLAEIEAYAGDAHEMMEGDAVTRHIALTPGALERLPACRRLLETPQWRGLTRYVASFDLEPAAFIQVVFSHVSGAASPDPQTTLHMDTFHPTMKAWLFLRDVEPATGPLTYVPGSHRPTRRREAWERAHSVRASGPDARARGGAFRADKSALRRLGYGEPVAFAVPANTLVVADTYGFHARGESLGPSTRLEIWAFSRPNPFSPFTGLDLWPAPLRKRQALVQWRLMGWAKALGLDRSRWRSTRPTAPTAPPEPWPRA